MKIKPIKIKINGQPFTVWDNWISMADIVELIDIKMSDAWVSEHGARVVYVEDGSSIHCEVNLMRTPGPVGWNNKP